MIADKEVEAWQHVALECPRGLGAILHQAGYHLHWLVDDKVRCIRKDEIVPADARPTPAQEHAWQVQREVTP